MGSPSDRVDPRVERKAARPQPIAGSRVYSNLYGQLRLPTGGYGQDIHGEWWVRPPGWSSQRVWKKDVYEHEDGTVTVHQTVAVNGSTYQLINGEWRMT